MQKTLDFSKTALILQLGSLMLPVSDFSVHTETPVITRILCSGAVCRSMLTDTQCTLTVSGTVLHTDGTAIAAQIQLLQMLHSAFDFTFSGTSYTGMTITKADCKCCGTDKTACFSLQLTGSLAEGIS